MKKLKYLVKYGVKKRVFTKAFLIANLVIGFLLLAITVLPTIINMATGGVSGTISDNILVVNTTGYDTGNSDLSNLLTNRIKYTIRQMGYVDEIDFSVSTKQEDIPTTDYYNEDSIYNGIIYIYLVENPENINSTNPDDNFLVKVQVYNKNMDGQISSLVPTAVRDFQRLKYSYDHNMYDNNLLVDLVPEDVLNPNIETGQTTNEILTAIAPILIVPIFILITFALQSIGIDIIDEKSSKAIEIIIASVPPTTHFIAKILSIIVYQAAQLGIYLVFGLLGVFINELLAGSTSGGQSWDVILGALNINIPLAVGLVLLCAILGATLYAVVGAFFASLAINQEDYQQIQTPVMLLLMVGYFGSIFGGMLQSNTILLVFSYIPFFSPLVIPVVYVMGQITIIEVLIGLIILIASIVLIMMLVAPLYRVSILSYDQSGLFKRITNTVKQSKALKENKKAYEGNKIE